MLHVAAFDFDNTLTTRSTVAPFLWELCGPLRMARVATCATVRGALPPDRARFKATAVAVGVRGRRIEEVEAVARRFARNLVSRHLDRGNVARLRDHQADGHRIVVVTSALEVYVRPVVAELGVEEVIGTALRVDGDRRCTGGMDRPGLIGDEKVRYLLEHLGLADDDELPERLCLWAYGDSSDDEPLLELGRRTRRATPAGSRSGAG